MPTRRPTSLQASDPGRAVLPVATPPPAEEVPAEGHTDSRFSVKCRWYRSVVTKGGQVGSSGKGRWPRCCFLLLGTILCRPPECQCPHVRNCTHCCIQGPCTPCVSRLNDCRCRTSRQRQAYPGPCRNPPQYCWVHPDKEAAIQCILCLRCKVDTKKSYHCSPECLREHWAFHRDFHQQSRENGAPPRQPPRVRCTWR